MDIHLRYAAIRKPTAYCGAALDGAAGYTIHSHFFANNFSALAAGAARCEPCYRAFTAKRRSADIGRIVDAGIAAPRIQTAAARAAA